MSSSARFSMASLRLRANSSETRLPDLVRMYCVPETDVRRGVEDEGESVGSASASANLTSALRSVYAETDTNLACGRAWCHEHR